MITLKEWKASKQAFADFVKIGDEVDDGIVESLTIGSTLESEELKSAFPLAFYKGTNLGMPEMGPLYAVFEWVGGVHWKLIGYENNCVFIDSEEGVDLLLTPPSMVSKGDTPVFDIWKKAVMDKYLWLCPENEELHKFLDSDFTKFDGDLSSLKRVVSAVEGAERFSKVHPDSYYAKRFPNSDNDLLDDLSVFD